jgi:hypothetical protein
MNSLSYYCYGICLLRASSESFCVPISKNVVWENAYRTKILLFCVGVEQRLSVF